MSKADGSYERNTQKYNLWKLKEYKRANPNENVIDMRQTRVRVNFFAISLRCVSLAHCDCFMIVTKWRKRDEMETFSYIFLFCCWISALSSGCFHLEKFERPEAADKNSTLFVLRFLGLCFRVLLQVLRFRIFWCFTCFIFEFWVLSSFWVFLFEFRFTLFPIFRFLSNDWPIGARLSIVRNPSGFILAKSIIINF